MNYSELYNLRLNRYGNDFQSRIQGEREDNFDTYLLRSIYRVDFSYNGTAIAGTLEKNKQNETETMRNLFTKKDVVIPNGTVLTITDLNNIQKKWMIYYLTDDINAAYNKYVCLKMTHTLSWTDNDGISRTCDAYFYGQEDNMLKDEIRSRSRMDTIYAENLKGSFFITAFNQYIKKDNYFIVGVSPAQEYYRVTGYDINSTPGVEYVTVDPIYEFDTSAAPTRTSNDDSEDFFWLTGGVDND